MDVRRFFDERYKKYGDHPESLDLNERSQRRRFEVLAEVGDMRGKRVLDLGSGLGDLYPFLVAKFGGVEYTGYDFSETFVARARAKHPDARFEVHDILADDIQDEFDFVVSSGMHNLETETNDIDMASLLAKAYRVARVAVAVNMLSVFADRVDDGFHKYDPARMLATALRLTRHTVLRHDYMPHDFTLYLYRAPRSG